MSAPRRRLTAPRSPYRPMASAAMGALLRNRDVQRALARAAARQARSLFGYSQPKTEYKSANNKHSVVLPKGDEMGSFEVTARKRKRKKSKPSVKKDIRKLKKRMGDLPTKSVKMVKKTVPFKLRVNSSPNYVSCFFMPVRTQTDLFNEITDVFDVDYTLKKTSIQVTKAFHQIRLANNTNANIKVSYQYVKCVDDDQESYVTNVLEYGRDRGDWTLIDQPTVTPAVGPNSNTALIPENFQLSIDDGFHNAKVFGVHPQKWEPMGPVLKARIGPSDTLKISRTIPAQVFKPENNLNEAFRYKQKDVFIMFKLEGDLVQKTGLTDTNLIGFSPTALIGSHFISYNLSTYDGLGQRIHSYTSLTDRTNLTTFGQMVEDSPDIEDYKQN